MEKFGFVKKELNAISIGNLGANFPLVNEQLYYELDKGKLILDRFADLHDALYLTREEILALKQLLNELSNEEIEAIISENEL